MRDISHKTKTLRTAVAKATIKANAKTLSLIRRNKLPKGDPLVVAKVAAVQAAKNTSQIIPFCHPIPVDFVDCRFELRENSIIVTTEVKAIYKTGVEMEALAAAAVAALTIYDMAKAVDEEMSIVGVSLVTKKGGKSDFKKPLGLKLKAAVLVMSDSVSAGRKEDVSGKLIVERLKQEGITVAEYRVIPDNASQIRQTLVEFSDKKRLDLIITTGGTGLSPRDVSPEATAESIEREIPGIAETLRAYGQERMPFTMLSRGKAGVRGNTVIINLPGSRKAVEESLDVLFPALFHSFTMLRGGGH
ncbi:MAG: bifunctional molybdenum cofactor biosynthesis protein MoaC/MoaB [Ignavibacteriales bacterium]|nr:bifunctional molybdenum cofactor biosynthesis protein MoaC/MoaB [Ignavibacteriales bacterium]